MIIVDSAYIINVDDLSVEATFRGVDIADAFQQLIEVIGIPPHSSVLLQ